MLVLLLLLLVLLLLLLLVVRPRHGEAARTSAKAFLLLCMLSLLLLLLLLVVVVVVLVVVAVAVLLLFLLVSVLLVVVVEGRAAGEEERRGPEQHACREDLYYVHVYTYIYIYIYTHNYVYIYIYVYMYLSSGDAQDHRLVLRTPLRDHQLHDPVQLHDLRIHGAHLHEGHRQGAAAPPDLRDGRGRRSVACGQRHRAPRLPQGRGDAGVPLRAQQPAAAREAACHRLQLRVDARAEEEERDVQLRRHLGRQGPEERLGL